MRFEAVNDTIILLKDESSRMTESGIFLSEYESKNMAEIPAPFTGTIDSVGEENEYKKGDRIAFSDIGGLYMKIDDKEYVVITPEMVIGILES